MSAAVSRFCRFSRSSGMNQPESSRALIRIADAPCVTAVSPSSLSTIGWEPQVERSMTDSRRWPKATRPLLHEPWPSGPRGTRASTMRATAVVSAVEPSNVISPHRPHMHNDLTRWTGFTPSGEQDHTRS